MGGGEVKHLLRGLMAQEGELANSAKSTKSTKSMPPRKHWSGAWMRTSAAVDYIVRLFSSCSVLKKINPCVASLKTRGDRFLENPNPQTRVHLKQYDPSRQEKATHNKPTSSEVAAIMVLPDNMDGNGTIERHILVQSIHGGMISIPFRHSCYMPLRYPLISHTASRAGIRTSRSMDTMPPTTFSLGGRD